MSDSKKPLPFHFQLLAGGVAGISEILIMYPLDVVKTRFQLLSHGHNTNTFETLKSIVKNEGFFSLYRGLLPPILLESPKRALKFSTNGQYTVWLQQSGLPFNYMTLPLCTGILAGSTEAIIVTPFDLVKIRLQDPLRRQEYKSTFDCLIKVWKENNNGGLLNYYKGFESTLWRHAVWSGIYFMTISGLKNIPFVKKFKDENPSNRILTDFLAGLVGGTLATFSNTPFDVVKTRVQSASKPFTTLWTLPALIHLARTEGIKALWKGFVPKVLRLGPGGGVMLVVYEKVCEFLRANYL